MNSTEWFCAQLQSSADGFVWGAELVPGARRYLQPPKDLGEWTAARHVFHMMNYELTIALPSMQQWLGSEIPNIEVLDEDRAWAKNRDPFEKLLAQFKEVRADQMALFQKFDADSWGAIREAVWGPVTLFWVVSKTYQHTAEHTSDILRMALFWDYFEEK